MTLFTVISLNTRYLFNTKEDHFCSYSLNWVKDLQEKAIYKTYSMKNPTEGFEQKIISEIKGNYTLNTTNNYEFRRTIICTYYFNEYKGLKE